MYCDEGSNDQQFFTISVNTSSLFHILLLFGLFTKLIFWHDLTLETLSKNHVLLLNYYFLNM